MYTYTHPQTIPVCRLGSKDGLLALEDLEYSFGLLLEKDERESIIGDVSVLELCLLIAMSHITEISEHNRPFNFEMVYSGWYRLFFLQWVWFCNGRLQFTE